MMNNFNAAAKEDAEHIKLATIMFQNLFPSINVATTKLSSCQRVLLLEYAPDSKRISLRHFSVAVQPSGVTKNLKSLLARKGMPDLGGMADVSEFFTRSGFGSESEGEDAEASRVDTEDVAVGGGRAVAAKQSRVRLSEVGPRMELEIVKVEEGLCGGRVLFHRYVKRTKEELQHQESEIETQRREKEKRRREQEANVKRKEAEKRRKEEAKEAKAGKGKPGAGQGKQWWEKEEEGAGAGRRGDRGEEDAEWYRKEVGEAPDEDFTRGASYSKRGGGGRGRGMGRGGRSGGRSSGGARGGVRKERGGGRGGSRGRDKR